MQAELAAQSINPSRSGGLKGRLRRALSFNAAQTLKEEADAEVEAEAAEKKEKEQRAIDGEGDDDDDDVSIKASQLNGKLKAKSSTPTIKVKPDQDMAATSPQSAIPPKKKGRAASLFNSRLNASTDNISLSSTVSSASVMIRKLGAMGKLARRNSLAGITSLFKDKDKNKSQAEEGGSSSKEKGKKKDKSAKGNAAQASVSLVTAELDRAGASGDWSVSAGEMNGLSPAAKLARQHTLKSNAEAAEARAREAKEREAAREREREEAEAREAARAVLATNGVTQVPVWDRNTATRSPQKGGAMRINEDGTRTFIEDEDEDESEDGHYQRFQQQQQQQQQQGWDDDDDWDLDGDGDEDATIRVGIQPRSSSDTGRSSSSGTEEHEPWAVDVRRSVERTRQPARGILKRAESYDQQSYLHEHSAPTQRMRSNSYNSPSQSELGPLARIPSPDPDHIDGLHRHGSHSSAHGQSPSIPTPVLPRLSFDSGSPLSMTFDTSVTSKDLPATPSSTSTSIFSTSTSLTTVSSSTPTTTHTENRTSQIFQHPNFNSSAPALASSSFGSKPPTLTHRSATSPSKRLTFATNLSVYDTFSASVYDRRSEPATWSRLTPALAQRIKEELNSYKMEEMEVHAASRIQ